MHLYKLDVLQGLGYYGYAKQVLTAYQDNHVQTTQVRKAA